MTEGRLHLYTPRLQAFELQTSNSANALILIGGLGNTLLDVPYFSQLPGKVSADWSIYQALIQSSGIGWGTGSLDRDIADIEQLINYLKTLGKKKFVLLGHSTGTQDAIHFALKKTGVLDGIILQASVSDREAMTEYFEQENWDLEAYNKEAQAVFDKDPLELLPKKFSDAFFRAPINAYRWLSLALPGGDDDYFSSDLPDSRLKETFGNLDIPLLLLYSGSDQFVPKSVDKEAVVSRWRSFTDEKLWSKHSKIVPGATHNIGEDSEEGAVEIFIESVDAFLKEL